ncbi:phytoene dehydrogenase-like protein [Altererythrobacter atlanticus]|uniref:Pyridine nucleotide-disulfide oxidoreductase domain-containing protein 2 n=1 Tax=Croceibacterium atlanticum TaxID=1267766 RepID=A0A0F7KVD0_9SPHN|nr:NAD(P)/FAD-dependent oxidoreductase [Croceibacterium atlanticum]AKH43192.1 Dehydrosqualene desaturase [Croceibacterium atlanticum]MBB5732103.1 phytoene dehydrogenase-like protein [Croceibacterium atlanticum]
MSDADIIAIGSGHNGLVAAAYLAVAGRKVLVLERNDWFGGGVVTRELTRPGFRHDQHSMSHIFIQGNPLLLDDELGLRRKYGLRYVFPETPMMSVWEDGTTLPLHRDPVKSAEAIRRFSARDAEAFLAMSRQAAEWLPMIRAGLYTPPMPVGAQSAMMDQSGEGREIMRTMAISTFDLMEELFEHDRVKAHFGRVAGENLVSPDEKATGIGAYVFLGFLEKYGFGVPVGGSGSLTDALIRCIEDHGGAVRAGAEVREVINDGSRASGVVLDNGERLSASEAIIGAIHPHILPDLVPSLPGSVARNARRTHVTDAACFTVHAALDEPLKFKAKNADGTDLSAVMYELMPAEYEDMRRAFDELRYGNFSPTPLVGLGQLTQHDPGRAPEGKAIFHAWDYVPYARKDGRSWDETKGKFARKIIGRMGDFIDNLPEAILDYHCDSPVDMERTSPSFHRGDLHGISTTTYQSGAHRPTPELGQYRVPGVDRLYLVGPFQHPGGGVFGAGRATAMVMAEDLGFEFDQARVQ